ncbi:MAG: hypothetical protein R3323_10630 [Wenzhouxiangellaceae bacterium]|nr:hypothetical protein [Wenzhouxiangellaceae bacterium]
MKSSRMLAALAVLVVAGGTLLLLASGPDAPERTADETARPSVSAGSDEADNGPASDAPERAPAASTGPDFPRAEPPPVETISPISFSEHNTAVEALEALAASAEFSRGDLAHAAWMWKQSCDSIRTPNGRLPVMIESEGFRDALLEFEAYCEGIEALELADDRFSSIEEVDRVFDGIEQAMDETPETWEEKAARLGPDRALEDLLIHLRDALRDANEPRAQAAIMQIIDTDLFPYIEETGPRSRWALSLLSFPLANAMICRATDGCRGTDHPIVVRYCLLEHTLRNRLCATPAHIDDAIHQTLTPVEYENFLQLHSWISGRLAAVGDQ